MEIRDMFRKKERKSSSKLETEWDYQLPNHFLYRTNYEVNVKSSVIQKEIKVIRVQPSPLMSANRANCEQSDQRNEDVSDETQNDKTANTQKGDGHYKATSLLSLPNKRPAAMNEIFVPSAHFNEPESNVKREIVSKNSGDNQLPEHLRNSSDLCYLNGKPTASMGESELFDNTFISPKLNLNGKKHSNLSSSTDVSSRKRFNDFYLLRMHNQVSTDTHKNDLACGDYAQPETEDNSLVNDNDINKRKIAPSEETAYLDRSADNDKFLDKSFNINNESLKDSDNNSCLGFQRQMFIDKESNSSSSNPFISKETSGKHDWLPNFPGDAETQNDSKDLSGLNFKLANSKQRDSSPKEACSIQKTLFKSCKNPNENTKRNNKNYYRIEINSDTDFSLQNNSSESSENSRFSSYLNNEFNAEQKELPRDPFCDHKTIASNNVFDLFKHNKNFSHQNCIDIISSVSSETTRDGKSDEHSMNNIDSTMNNTTCELMANAGISLACKTYDSHTTFKRICLPDEQTTVKFRLVSDSSEGSGSVGFDIEPSQSQRSIIRLDAESSFITQEDFRTATTQSDESSSLAIDTEQESTTSNTYHSDIDSDKWKTSVSGLVEYFENLNSETKIGEKKVKSGPLVQINFNYDGTDEKNQNFLGPNKNKRKLHEIDGMNKGCLTSDKDCKDEENTYNTRQRCFDNDCQRKSTDLLYHKQSKKTEKCFPAEGHDTNEEDLMDRTGWDVYYIHKLKEPSSASGDPKGDISHFPTSKSNIDLSQSQPLNLETKHLKESAGSKAAGDSPQANNEKLASDLLQRKGLHPNSSGDFQYEEQEAYSSKQFSFPETTCDDSSGIHQKGCLFYRFHNFDNGFEPLGENSVEQKEFLKNSRLARTKIISYKRESKPVGNLERKEYQCSVPRSVPLPALIRKLCNQDSESDSPHRMKLNRQISPSRVEVNRSKPASNGLGTVSNPFKQAMILNRNRSDFSVESSFPKESSDKAVKSCIFNPGLVKKSTENKVSNSNQTTVFSRRRVMALLAMSIMFLFAVSDWENLLKYFEGLV